MTMEQVTKKCPRCKEIKPVADFRTEPSRHRGIAIYCRTCDPIIRHEKYLARHEKHNVYTKAYQAARPKKRAEWARRYALKKTYGLTPEQWDEMYKRQDGRCLICRKRQTRKRLFVDHCHKTGVVRGLLCSTCNTGIGCFKHDAELIARSIEYLAGRLVA